VTTCGANACYGTHSECIIVCSPFVLHLQKPAKAGAEAFPNPGKAEYISFPWSVVEEMRADDVHFPDGGAEVAAATKLSETTDAQIGRRAGLANKSAGGQRQLQQTNQAWLNPDADPNAGAAAARAGESGRGGFDQFKANAHLGA